MGMTELGTRVKCGANPQKVAALPDIPASLAARAKQNGAEIARAAVI
jgi:hypothetical protein